MGIQDSIIMEQIPSYSTLCKCKALQYFGNVLTSYSFFLYYLGKNIKTLSTLDYKIHISPENIPVMYTTLNLAFSFKQLFGSIITLHLMAFKVLAGHRGMCLYFQGLGRLRQEDFKFKASLINLVIPCLKK